MTVFHRNEQRGDLPETLQGGVLAIGNFDGVHRGHQAVLSRALEIASDRKIPSLVLTFEPHPRTIFTPDKPVFRITPAPLKAQILEKMGFNAVLEYPFDRTFAGRSAEEFIQSVLIDWIDAKEIVTGFDFHFGKGREGGPAYLLAAGGRHGFGVSLIDAFRDENTDVISSSRIRSLISEGDMVETAGLLGYRYTVQSPVIHGQKLGRTLGFPTANMALPVDVQLKAGIYAVRFRLEDGRVFDGVSSFGYRPTVTDHGAALLETMLFDFSGDLYGQTCSVSFFGFLRPEMKFDGLEPLVEQMNRDVEEARALLSGVKPLGSIDQAIAF
ncbi:bifunctional riboflavin kinase/FAD synthetase [Rhizobium sp. KVB221]|uniref:Riboflavin biosynthesis protein n=1 Tax=Rhizobium setariae TaxID=2801340 RepID=A0A936YLY6_9HYPH|nr:bifunctional riboflavin kinase/FAD synthetase [Rhizobium setariae]MBL0370579.1 bifunctional riboflavin kinase/FAD synthetase [Rhizobium setariae]